MTTTRKYICDVCGLAGGQHTRIPHPFLTLAEWDNASEERRTAWIKTDRVLSPADAEILRLREVKDGEAGGRCDCTKGLIGVHYGCPVHDPRPRPEPRIVVECLSCLIRTGDSQYKNLSEVDANSHRHLRHDVREVKA